MISKRLLGCVGFLLVVSVGLRAQTPTVVQALPTRTLVAGGASASIHLRDYFALPTVTGPVVQFDTPKGKFNVELFSADTPKTVTNFLNYTNGGDYVNSFVHRSVPGFVIQGGGFVLDDHSVEPIATDAPIENEPKFSNTRGTIAMAKTSLGPHTATSQWFINLANNANPLDSDNGGYTVFGRVLGTGMTAVVDQIATVPVYDATGVLGATFNQLPLINYNNQIGIVSENIVFSRIRSAPIFPEVASGDVSALAFSATSSNPAVATVEVTASTLTVKPAAAGTTSVTAHVTDPNGNTQQTSFTATVVSNPLFTTEPASQAVEQGGSGSLTMAVSGNPTLQWQRNGANLNNVTAGTVNITNMQPSIAGLYTVVASSGGAASVSKPAILGVTTSSKVIGGGNEIDPNVLHPSGKTYDQVLLTGAAAAITAEHTIPQTTRLSYIDLDNDIVQVEFSGPGTLSILLDESSGPAAPLNYAQSVSYMKGHASIVISGATEHTNVSVFTVGRATAFDPTNTFNFLEPVSETNRPADNKSSLFVGHETTQYDGIADISRISIISSNGKFGGIRAANASFYDIKGHTGIYAPGVEFHGPIYVHDINAYESATPVLVVGAALGPTGITGGDLYQTNGRPVLVNGVSQLPFLAGQDSHGKALPATKNQATLRNSAGENVTSQIVVNP